MGCSTSTSSSPAPATRPVAATKGTVGQQQQPQHGSQRGSFDLPASFTSQEDDPTSGTLIHDGVGSMITQTGPSTGTVVSRPMASRAGLVQHKRIFCEPDEAPQNSKNYGGIDQDVFRAQLRMAQTPALSPASVRASEGGWMEDQILAYP